MREVFGAVIATALVLIAVFVPVAFFPGTTGRLYQQFALTIAFCRRHFRVQRPDADAGAVGASAQARGPRPGTNLRRHRGSDSTVEPGCTSARSGGLMRVRWAVAVVFVGLLGLTYFVYQRVPQAFLPEEDAGWFMTLVQAPAGASLEYTSNVVARSREGPDEHCRKWSRSSRSAASASQATRRTRA